MNVINMNRVVYVLSILGVSIALTSSSNSSEGGLQNFSEGNVDPWSRIIGGDEVEPNSIPYQAALLLNGVSLCGGSLISTTTVLTAAHCTIEASFVVVVLGAHRLEAAETNQVRLTSSNIVNHEGYTEYLENDIAVVLLPSEVILNKAIQPIPLAPSSALSYAGSNAYLTGWGMTNDTSGISPVLRGVSLQVMTNSDCAVRYVFLRPSNICTSGVGVFGACHSDSGGPLVVDGVQVGIVSFGSSSCVEEHPTGFVRVSYFRDWIEENAGV